MRSARFSTTEAHLQALLRAEDVGGLPLRRLAAIAGAGTFLYGVVMGSRDVDALQALYSGVKVPLLLAVATTLCLPPFFVLNTVLGLRDDFARACRGILSSQAVMAVTLASLAPVIGVAYAWSRDYATAMTFNGVAFLIATVAAQLTLTRHYDPLVRRNRRHGLASRAWVVLYVFVSIQMAWVLRPFVGSPGLETTFFREEAWSNAYVVVVEILRRLVT